MYFVRTPSNNYCGYIIKHKYRIKESDYTMQIIKFTACLPLLLVSALRVNVGTDYMQTYYKGFQNVINGNNFDHFEIGYKLLIYLSYFISNNPQIIFVTTSILFIVTTFYAIYNESPDVVYSVYLLVVTRYYFISMNMVKQFVAMAILLYSIKYLGLKKRNYKFWIFLIIAVLIHYSAIVGVGFWILDKISISKMKFWIITFFTCIFYFIFIKFNFSVLVQKLFFGTKYYKYFSNSFLYAGSNFAKWTFILNVCILIIFYLKLNDKSDNKYRLYFKLQLVACILCVFMPLIPLVERIFFYFGFIQILSIPYVIGFYKRGYERLAIKLGVGFVLTLYCYIDIFVKLDHEVLPYFSVFTI